MSTRSAIHTTASCEVTVRSLALALMALMGAGCSDDDATVAETDAGAPPATRGRDAATSDAGAERDAGAETLLCNGSGALCTRPYDEVVFPGTHNGHAAEEYGYNLAVMNQLSGLTTQLEDGIRVMLLDAWYLDDGSTAFCHGVCSIASTPHLDGLAEIAAFLEANPREVLTIIYEDHISTEDLVADLEASGLADRAYTKRSGEPWPTLEEMIDADQRLVVTTEQGRPPPDWVHHVWDVGFDTPYTFRSEADFSCALNRGSRDNDLFLVNHWVGTDLGLPSEDGAQQVNVFDVLHDRVTQCAAEAGHIPNFVAVDFYEHGDLFEVVDVLNGL